MTTKEMVVTPELAMRWLEECNTHNRKIRDSVVQRYARDMAAGRWRLTHQGIAFDKNEGAADKTLLDGQHRLWAICESNTPVRLMVSFGVPSDAQGVIDDSLPRTMVDVLRLVHDTEATNLQIAIAKRLASPDQKLKLTREETVAALNAHAEAIAFAVEAFPRVVRGISTAPVMTVVARAWYTVKKRDVLARFCEVLSEGRQGDVSEDPIILLRNWLLEKAPVRGGKQSQTSNIYGKTERALSAYLNGERIGILYPASSELFPLPLDKILTVSRADAAAAKKKIKTGKLAKAS